MPGDGDLPAAGGSEEAQSTPAEPAEDVLGRVILIGGDKKQIGPGPAGDS